MDLTTSLSTPLHFHNKMSITKSDWLLIYPGKNNIACFPFCLIMEFVNVFTHKPFIKLQVDYLPWFLMYALTCEYLSLVRILKNFPLYVPTWTIEKSKVFPIELSIFCWVHSPGESNLPSLILEQQNLSHLEFAFDNTSKLCHWQGKYWFLYLVKDCTPKP